MRHSSAPPGNKHCCYRPVRSWEEWAGLRENLLRVCVAPLPLTHTNTFSHINGGNATQLLLLGAEDEPNYKTIYGDSKTQGRIPRREMHRVYSALMTILRCASISLYKWKRTVLSKLWRSSVRLVRNKWGQIKQQVFEMIAKWSANGVTVLQ